MEKAADLPVVPPRYAEEPRRGEIGCYNFQRTTVQAMATPWVPRNPRPIEGPDQVREILELAS